MTDESKLDENEAFIPVYLVNEKSADKLLERLRAGENVVGLVPLNDDVDVDAIRNHLDAIATPEETATLYARLGKFQEQLKNTPVERNPAAIDAAAKKVDSTEIGRRLFGEIAVNKKLATLDEVDKDAQPMKSADGKKLLSKNRLDPDDILEDKSKGSRIWNGLGAMVTELEAAAGAFHKFAQAMI